MRVVYAPVASQEIREIWRHNAERYGTDHANDYRAFLHQSVGSLVTEHAHGKLIEDMRGSATS